ncbi:n-acetylglutamate synthase [Paenibacillus turpanensis]|uniref:n-acetylglutamate synthase n=1 Tax=Paenibacillus turpanensis TaxID=2689078 RepID=UPI00140B6CBD|nr:n-acetylglutamate synthase [Paenibacillus turpanensis]
MSTIHYDGRIFKTINNTANGEVNQQTIFRYYQKDQVVWADYSGGGIIVGHLVAVVDDEGGLDMRYHHINESLERMTGICKSKPEVLPDGRLRMHEEWEWTCKDRSKGFSVIEEVID